MKKRGIAIFSIALGVFLLIVVVGVSANAISSRKTPTSVNGDVAMQATLSAYRTREAAYEVLIQEANAQLILANEALATLDASGEVESDELEGISVAGAIEIAQGVAVLPDSILGDPELVNFEGTIAYEVKYEQGAIYVSYATGEVLLNGTTTFGQEIGQMEAEEIAKNYLGLNNVVQSDKVSINGKELFRIIFSVGHFVYIDSTGEIVYVQMHIASEPTSTLEDSSNSGSNSDNSSSYDDDHEEHDDDDD